MPLTSYLVKTVHASLHLPREVRNPIFHALLVSFHLHPDPCLNQPCAEQLVQGGYARRVERFLATCRTSEKSLLDIINGYRMRSAESVRRGSRSSQVAAGHVS